MEYFCKSIWPVIKKDTIYVFTFLGMITTIGGILAIFDIDISKQCYAFLIIVGMVVIIIINIPRKTYEFNIKGRDIKITLKLGNILDENSALIIPTNTTFDTKMDDDFISSQSVQGQIQEKYFKDNISKLDDLIEKELKNKQYTELTDRKDSKNKRYEIGTTLKINVDGRRLYFLADSNINASGNTINPSIADITDALASLWQYILNCGNVEPIAIPVIGTGRMGILDSRESIIKNIIFSFVASSTTKKIATELIIYIRKEDIKKYNIDINNIVKYMDYVCEYQYEDFDDKKYGTGIA